MSRVSGDRQSVVDTSCMIQPSGNDELVGFRPIIGETALFEKRYSP